MDSNLSLKVAESYWFRSFDTMLQWLDFSACGSPSVVYFMNETKAILLIIAGCAVIYLGFTSKQFYVANAGTRLGPPVARWKGRLFFVVGGAVSLFVGLKYFFDVNK